MQGKVIGVDTFGESAPADDVYKALGVTAENVVKAVEEQL
jgi:transketolase